jgi:hypothetical protein
MPPFPLERLAYSLVLSLSAQKLHVSGKENKVDINQGNTNGRKMQLSLWVSLSSGAVSASCFSIGYHPSPKLRTPPE